MRRGKLDIKTFSPESFLLRTMEHCVKKLTNCRYKMDKIQDHKLLSLQEFLQRDKCLSIPFQRFIGHGSYGSQRMILENKQFRGPVTYEKRTFLAIVSTHFDFGTLCT
ncbi:hypothetical protein AOG1_23650 [Geobacter sp. AOG1]|nr:hypothetical protein AOG1_23650 [Geobacter sp. AOG1]